MTTIAIDPGSSSGAMVVQRVDGNPPLAYNLPGTVADLASRMLALSGQEARVVIENVGGSRPGNSARSIRTFATHVGHLEMAAELLFNGCVKVTPHAWQKWLLGDALPHGSGAAEKKARKEAIYREVLRRGVVCTKRQADAAGIFLWAKENVK